MFNFLKLFFIFSILILKPYYSHALTINKVPTAGKDAYWAKNPNNPEQKIIMVPSLHTYVARFMDKSLSETINNSDVIVLETDEQKPIDEKNIISLTKSRFVQNEKKLRELGAISEEPYLKNENPWTDTLQDRDRNIIGRLFKDILKGSDISVLHPKYVVDFLISYHRVKSHSFGFDQHLQKKFRMQNKIVVGLETSEYRKKLGQEATATHYIEYDNPLDGADLSGVGDINHLINKILAVDSSSPKRKQGDADWNMYMASENSEKYANDPSIAQRNKHWIPQLINIFDKHKNKSIVVVVGAAHFIGSKGIVSLLEKERFSFEKFSGGPVAQNAFG